MICQEREMDLLLYSLGELDPIRHILTALHLVRCARCREKQAVLRGASNQLARALRPPAGTPGGLVRRPFRNPAYQGAALWIAIIFIAVLLLGVFTFRHSINLNLMAPPSRQKDDGCSPGLPSDRCR